MIQTAPVLVTDLRHLRNYVTAETRVLSLLDCHSNQSRHPVFHTRRDVLPAAHLTLVCDDNDEPLSDGTDPNEFHVTQLLEFGLTDRSRNLTIHCVHGIGRSTAAAIAILCARTNPNQALRHMHEIGRTRPLFCPNLIILRIADGLLRGRRQILAAMSEYENDHPETQRLRRRRSNIGRVLV
jgi:predicted protein tyrosine phosphatase